MKVTGELSKFVYFLYYCPSKGGYFGFQDFEMGIRVRSREVFAYAEKLPGPQFCVRLPEVFAYGSCPSAEARLYLIFFFFFLFFFFLFFAAIGLIC